MIGRVDRDLLRAVVPPGTDTSRRLVELAADGPPRLVDALAQYWRFAPQQPCARPIRAGESFFVKLDLLPNLYAGVPPFGIARSVFGWPGR